jgi:hypothetical protein
MPGEYSTNPDKANEAFRHTDGVDVGRHKVDTEEAAKLTRFMAETEDGGFENEKAGNKWNTRKESEKVGEMIAQQEIGRKAAEINNNPNAMLNVQDYSDEQAIVMLMRSRNEAREAIKRSEELDLRAKENADAAALKKARETLK